MSQTLREGAFAKINLTLDVLGKRPDGYHDLQSVRGHHILPLCALIKWQFQVVPP